MLSQGFFDAEDVGHHLPFIVRGAASPNFPITNDRFEWIARPEFQWVDRLHVVMSVNHHRATIGDVLVAGDDNRVFRRLVEFGGETHRCKFGDQPFSARSYVRRVASVGGDAREAEKRK